MNKKIFGAVIALIVVICSYLYATPYLALNTIKNAAQEGDSEKVSAYIDYPSVRQSFKEQVNAQVVKKLATEDTDGWEALGAMIATKMVEQIVDAVVTPEGMTMILQGKELKDNLSNNNEIESTNSSIKPELDYSTRYLSMDMFEVTLKNKESNKDLKIIMKRDGLSWKIIKLVMPLSDSLSKESEPVAKVQETEFSSEIENSPVISQSAITANFDHAGIQKGAYLESCYHDPCSTAKVMEFKQLSQTPTESNIELTLVGGSKGWDSEKIDWNHESHKTQIHCSITKPTIQIDDQVTVIPLNDNGVPGVLWSSAETYMQACHNYTGEMGAGIQKYGYNVQNVD